MKELYAKLTEFLNNQAKIFIQPHNMPDPDAIASSYGLQQLLKQMNIESEIVYANTIEKNNSKTMVEMFDIEMTIKGKNFVCDQRDCLILIDTQLGNSNVTKLQCEHVAVIDHHKEAINYSYFYIDIQEEVGSCSTIIASYYKKMGFIPNTNVATALLYGIMNDTNNLTRNCEKVDLDYFYWLYEMSDLFKIKKLRMNEIGRHDLYAYAKALETFEVYGNIAFVHIEECNDSLLGTISDMIYSIEGVSVVVAYAKRIDGIKFSIRSGEINISANELVKYIIDDKGVGGGHKEMAGGFIMEEEMSFLANKELDTYVRFRAIAYVESK